MAILQRIKNVASTLIHHPVKSFTTGLKTVGTQLANVRTLPSGKILSGGSVGLLGGPVRAGAGGVGRIFTKGKQYLARQFTNPFAGVSIGEGFSNLGKRFLGYGLTGAGFGLAYTGSKALTSGGSPSFFDILKGAGHGTLAGANVPGAVIGSGEGIIEKYFGGPDTVRSNFMNIPGKTTAEEALLEAQMLKDKLAGTIVGIPKSDLFENFPSPNITFAPPSFTGGSVNVGTPSGPDLTPLILTLLGGGALGYVLGKRKKKRRKRYKKKGRR